MIKKIKNIGPGLIITSAFIGPGTVTLCSLSGIEFGYSLIWCVIFSIIATCYLQELSSRLGIISRKGLSDVLKENKNQLIKKSSYLLIVLSLFIGNTAYESGNISGTVMGLETFLGSGLINNSPISINIYPILIGIILVGIILVGSYNVFEKLLVGLVFIMSITFIITAILSKPSLSDLISGLKPSVNKTNYLYVIGLIGTTVVPYNLFLHSYIAKKKWKTIEDYKLSIPDTIISILIGGIISISIIITAASNNHLINSSNIKNAIDLGGQLTPYLGDFSKYFISIGLFSAGITSSITAPIATSYALSGIFNYKAEWKDKNFKIVAIIIILFGIIFSSINYSPIIIIKLAQFINGLFLPLISIFLLWAINQKKIMGNYINSIGYNLLGVVIIMVSILIGLKSLITI
ncbi:MAG: Nramp family divalent metal transporter [Bacteroidota bacterium]|nr:Nramp family divalent metal transporter [Bacteroidota bacterium]